MSEASILSDKAQKPLVYNKLLPYSEEIPSEALNQLKEIKENLSKSVIFKDIRPGCIHWISQLQKYIRLYELYFSKEDHIKFVNLTYQLVVIPDQEFWVTAKFAQTLNALLKKKELLSPDDLTLPWKPLMLLYEKLFHSSYKNIGLIMLPQNAEPLIKSTIRSCRPYFPLEATKEILSKWKPQLCPYDVSMYRSISCLELFLPTMLPSPSFHHGWKLWFEEFLDLWVSFLNEPAWSSSLFCLFARLSWHNIGHVNWEPHLPLIFNRILWQFHLPVSYKKLQVSSRKGLETWSAAMFIVANLGGNSKTQCFLEHLLKILGSYFHPSNTGHWTRSLTDFLLKLTNYFVQRVHTERFRKDSWISKPQKEKLLSEDDITKFVNSLRYSVNLMIFSKTGSYEAGLILQRLALLRPEIVIPPLVDLLYSAANTMTEPHRLMAALQCTVKVARPLVIGGRRFPVEEIRYPEGPSHVIPFLFLALPGIDSNDVHKCMVTLQFIATLVAMVPLVNCSSAVEEIPDLSEIEHDLCLQTADFENFVLEFINKAICLIENLSLEQSASGEREKENMNFEENMMEIGLASTFKTILTQSHPSIFDSAISSLSVYSRGRCFETKVAGKFIAALWRSAAKVNAEKTLSLFLPGVCRLIIALTEGSESKEEENLDEELLFNLLVLSELAQSKGSVLIKHIPQISEVLHGTLHLKSRKGYKIASSILRNVLWSLNLTTTSDVRSTVYSWDTPFSEYLPIQRWGESGNLDNLNMEWNEPGEEEEKAIDLLIRTFLVPELITIRKVSEGDSTISRDRLHQSLCITQDILYAGGSFPMWKEDEISLVEMSVKRETSSIKLRSYDLSVSLNEEGFDSNIRKAIADVTLSLVQYLLSVESDDTKSFNYASSIFLNLCFFHGIKRDEFETRWKSFERVKKSLSDNVVKRKQHIRALLVERIILQYETRILEFSTPVFSNTHLQIMRSLLKLSTSRYSEVRRKSQAVLSTFFRQFPYSYKLLIPSLIEILKKDPVSDHKEIKGALYVILGSKEKSLVVRRDWDTLYQLYPALIKMKHSEKLSIIKLYDSILRTVSKRFELFAVFLTVSDSAISSAYDLLHSNEPAVSDCSIGEMDQINATKRFENRQNLNLEHYNSLVKELSNLLSSETLHWRRIHFCLNLLGILVRPDVVFPSEGVEIMTSYLINDNISLRKIALVYMSFILKTQKRKHKCIEIDPLKINGDFSKTVILPGDNRQDNRWLQYDSKYVHVSEEEWNKTIFVHKTWIGWYCWPENMEVYASYAEQPQTKRTLEELQEEEKPIFKFFLSDDNVDKLMSFLSLEENKGQDRFDIKKYLLFKGLFRNFGNIFFPKIEYHLKNMIKDGSESNQRCAAEIIAGMLRGSKHWNFDETQNLLKNVCEILRSVFSKISSETLEDWGSCLSSVSMDRDPNRLAPIIELLMEDIIPEGEVSFIISSRLYLLQGFLGQQEWRVATCYHRLLEVLKEHLCSPYKVIRDKIGLLLYRVFMRDESIANSSGTISPHHSDFINEVLPKLSPLSGDSANGGACSTSHLTSDSHSVPSVSCSDLLIPSPMECEEQVILHSYSSSEFASPGDSASISEGDQTGQKNIILKNIVSEEKDSIHLMKELPSPPDDFLGSANIYEEKDQLEKKTAFRIMNTVCKYLKFVAASYTTAVPSDLYKFLPYLCQLESIDSDTEVRNNCLTALAYLSRVIIAPQELVIPIHVVQSICQNGSWRARTSALSFLQVLIFNNMFTVLENLEAYDVVKTIVLKSLEDPLAEVRQMAAQVLSGLIYTSFIEADEKFINQFIQKLNHCKRKDQKKSQKSVEISERHSGALGLCACVEAYPYDVPSFMPEVLVILCEHIHNPPPVSTDIKLTLSNFRRTHHDSWDHHKKNFTADQLSVLTDVLISPSYYA